MTDNLPAPVPEPSGQVILYQPDDGIARIEVRLEGETVWLTQRAMADLFQTTKQNVSLHIQHVFDEGELRPEATVKQYLTVQTEGNRQIRRAVEPLQSQRHYRRWIPRQVPPWHPVSYLGNRAAPGVSHQRLYPRRSPAQAGRGRQLLRGIARPHPRHPLVGAGLLAEGARHLRHQHRL